MKNLLASRVNGVCQKSKNQKAGRQKKKKKKKKKELVGHRFLFAGFLKKCQVLIHAHVQYTVIIFFITSNQLFYNRISSFY